MNITQCPQCGGKVRSESIGWTCESCHGFIDMQGGFHPHREEPFMSPMTNDDRIRAVDRLQAENEKLRAELEKAKRTIAMMWFAYVNSGKETPHSYETEATEEAERLLGPWEECMPKYLRRGSKKED